MIGGTVNHVAEARAKLLHQFQEAERLLLILDTASVQVQEFEDAFFDTVAGLHIDNAVGETLTSIGKIVGQERVTTDDDLFRLYVRARWLAASASGTTDELIGVAVAALGQSDDVVVRWFRYLHAEIALLTDDGIDADVADVLIDLLTVATAAGHRTTLVSSEAPAASTFTFDGTPAQGFDVATMADGREG